MTAEDNAVGRITADYDPVSVAISGGWRF